MLCYAVQIGSLAPLKSNIIIPVGTVASPRALQFTEAIPSTLMAGQFFLCLLFVRLFVFYFHVSQGYLEISSMKVNVSGRPDLSIIFLAYMWLLIEDSFS